MADTIGSEQVKDAVETTDKSVEDAKVSTYSIIPSYLKKKVKALKKLQLEHVHLESVFFKELYELELKYNRRAAPLYEKRKLIVTGAVEPTEEECDFPSDDEDKEIKGSTITDSDPGKKKTEDAQVKKETEEIKDVKGIPEFWLTVFNNASVLAEIIEEHDEPILKHLLDVKATPRSNPMGFMLQFCFEPNEFFTNTILTKYYEKKCDPDKDNPFSFDGLEIYKCKGCTIDWKKGMNVTVKTIKKKQKCKRLGPVRMITRTVKNDSFFNFFNPPVIPEGGEGKMNEAEYDALTDDFKIGNFINDHIIPRAILFFTGENLADDESDSEDDEEDGEESSSDSSSDDDDDDNEKETINDNVPVTIKKSTDPKSGQSTTTASVACRQQ